MFVRFDGILVHGSMGTNKTNNLLIITDAGRRLFHATREMPVPAAPTEGEWREHSTALTMCGLEITAQTAGFVRAGHPTEITCPECRVAARADGPATASGRNTSRRAAGPNRTFTFKKRK